MSNVALTAVKTYVRHIDFENWAQWGAIFVIAMVSVTTAVYILSQNTPQMAEDAEAVTTVINAFFIYLVALPLITPALRGYRASKEASNE